MPAELNIGTSLAYGLPASVNALKLNRHTFWCGQSGSGKTYALGVLLEKVISQTHMPVVVLDPNADFVHLNEVRSDARGEVADALRQRDIRVLRAGENTPRLCLKFADLDMRTQAAMLRLDPILDAEQFNTMLQVSTRDLAAIEGSLPQWLRSQNIDAYTQIALRLENLGVLEWPIWSWGDKTVPQFVSEKADATIVDLGGFDTSEQMQLVALAVLDDLWNNRHERIGRLIVIDEAHNLCPPQPATPLERLLTERIVQIAAEGRKYGIWLLLSTQRPSKIHPNVISQCDNLALMKMSSQRDLDELASIFSFADSELIAQSPTFQQGQALFAGGFTDQDLLVQMADRLTREGGSDVRVELR